MLHEPTFIKGFCTSNVPIIELQKIKEIFTHHIMERNRFAYCTCGSLQESETPPPFPKNHSQPYTRLAKVL